MQDFRRGRVPSLFVRIILLLLFPGLISSHAQTTTDSELKAAYLFNFAKFVQWPAGTFENQTTPIQICVMNDRSIMSDLNRIVKGKIVAGRPISVVAVPWGERAHTCQILFVRAPERTQTRHILELLGKTSILTVSDSTGFVEEGGIINFVLQGDHIQFQVNHKAASQVGLYISSRLLSVAKLVVE